MSEIVIKRRPSKYPQVGDLRTRISIYERALQTPSFNEESTFIQNHTLIATVWSMVKTFFPENTFDGVDVSLRITHEFTIRYRSDIVVDNIIKHDSIAYRINKITNPDLRKRWLFLQCDLLGDETLEVNR